MLHDHDHDNGADDDRLRRLFGHRNGRCSEGRRVVVTPGAFSPETAGGPATAELIGMLLGLVGVLALTFGNWRR